MFEQVIVQLVAGAVLKDQPYQILRDYDFVKACNVRVQELAVMVDLAREVGVLFLGRLEHDLRVQRGLVFDLLRVHGACHLGAIDEFVRGQVDLAKRALANQAADGVVADSTEVAAVELAVSTGVSHVGCLVVCLVLL
jgi:hypothetical protein